MIVQQQSRRNNCGFMRIYGAYMDSSTKLDEMFHISINSRKVITQEKKP